MNSQLKKTLSALCFSLSVMMLLPVKATGNTIDTLNIDGAWCWFADPRAVYHNATKEQTYFAWVNSKGDIVASSYNHKTGVLLENTIHKNFQVDDHANPSIFIRNDNRIMVFYGAHFGSTMYCVISDNAEDISSFGDPINFGSLVTYPYPFYVDSSIYCFFRGGDDWHPRLCISDDNGLTWSSQYLVVSGGGQRPYTRYTQDNSGGIHIAFTHGHPRQEGNNKIYYAYLKDDKFYNADGTFIKDFSKTNPLSIDAGEPEIVYNASNGKGWIWDVAVDENNYPVMVYAVFPSDTDHRYYYSRWNGTTWVTNEICASGGWFPQTPAGNTEPEPNYSGGIILDGDNTNVVYLSKQVNGVFEIFKYTTTDMGVTWDSVAITENTPADLVNVRPIVPRSHKKGYFDVLWMRGKYELYTDYNTSILYQSNQKQAREFDFGNLQQEANNAINYVPNNTLYSNDFGFADTTAIMQGADAGGNGNTSDFVSGHDNKTFKIYVLNGTYKLTLTQGHSSELYDSMRVVVNNNDTLDILSAGGGSWIDTSMLVNVTTDNMLNIEFSDFGGSPNWMVNAVKIEAKEIFIDSISLHPKEARLKLLEELDLKVSLYPSLSASHNLNWSVSDSTMASVDNGKVVALRPGDVYIKAQVGQSAIADSCLLTIQEPYFLDSAFFDLGTINSPVAISARRITESTLIGNSFGWIDNTGLAARDRGGNDDETSDLVFSSEANTFRVYLNNNTYPVVITQGDGDYAHDSMMITANGEVAASSVSTSAGQFIETTFDAVVSDGILDLTFSDAGGSDENWVLNSIAIGYTKQVVGIETISFQKDEDWASYKVIDLNGRILHEAKKNGSDKIMLPEFIQTGVYFISMFNKNNRLIRVKKVFHSGYDF